MCSSDLESYGWSVIQALISRSDRRLAPVIAAARGQLSSLGGWKRAYRERRAEAPEPPLPSWDAVVHSRWDPLAPLPWQHLEAGLALTVLRQHHSQALQGSGLADSGSGE